MPHFYHRHLSITQGQHQIPCPAVLSHMRWLWNCSLKGDLGNRSSQCTRLKVASLWSCSKLNLDPEYQGPLYMNMLYSLVDVQFAVSQHCMSQLFHMHTCADVHVLLTAAAFSLLSPRATWASNRSCKRRGRAVA